MVNLTLTHRNYRANARLLSGVVVQANLAEGGHAHLLFKRAPSLILKDIQRLPLEHLWQKLANAHRLFTRLDVDQVASVEAADDVDHFHLDIRVNPSL